MCPLSSARLSDVSPGICCSQFSRVGVTVPTGHSCCLHLPGFLQDCAIWACEHLPVGSLGKTLNAVRLQPHMMGETNQRVKAAQTSPGETRSASNAEEPGHDGEKWATGTHSRRQWTQDASIDLYMCIYGIFLVNSIGRC